MRTSTKPVSTGNPATQQRTEKQRVSDVAEIVAEPGPVEVNMVHLYFAIQQPGTPSR